MRPTRQLYVVGDKGITWITGEEENARAFSSRPGTRNLLRTRSHQRVLVWCS